MDFEHNYAEFGNAISCGRVTIQKWCNIILCTLDIYAVWTRMIGWVNAHVFAGWVSRRVHVLLFLGVQICKGIFFFKKNSKYCNPGKCIYHISNDSNGPKPLPSSLRKVPKKSFGKWISWNRGRPGLMYIPYIQVLLALRHQWSFLQMFHPEWIRVLQWRSMKRGRAALWYFCFASWGISGNWRFSVRCQSIGWWECCFLHFGWSSPS